MHKNKLLFFFLVLASLFIIPNQIFAQGVTTASMNGIVQDAEGNPLPGANVIAVHVPSGTQYGASTRTTGLFNLPNVRVGGPYTVTVSFVGYNQQKQEIVTLNIGQNFKLEFTLESEAVEIGEVVVSGEQDNVLNSGRTGAETFINPDEVSILPTIKRSTRDLTRLDPRSDGNFSFGGRNWLYNNISVDGSYFNNPFGLDDPAPGGQTNAEPLPYDAVEQVQVSVAPFDVREGGFTGAGINIVTRSGTNNIRGSVYGFYRNESLQGVKIGDTELLNPELTFYQSGFSASGPLIPNKLFLFINAEIERREDPGSGAFTADTDNDPTNNAPGVSRVRASALDSIRQRMIDVYEYDPGTYQGFIHETNNEKILVKLDWNVNENNNLSFRYNFLNAEWQKPPHPFAISYNNTGRGPNQNTLPFQNSGYKMNNELNSLALELNSRGESFSNRFFVSYNIFRDFREPVSDPYPTIEIGVGGITYTTIGHEPFSIHNILDQNVLQITNNFSYYLGNHVLTAGATFEYFDFFNSFNLFRYGFMGFNTWPGGTTFESLGAFFAATDPADPQDFDSFIIPDTEPFKGEFIEVGQLAFYGQDEFLASDQFSLIFGLRVDIPMYITEPVDNPWSRSLLLLDEDDAAEIVDQSKLPDATPLFSPRIGFNWDVSGDRSTQLRGGTGIFTGRLPFVWIGNNISNPGLNPNLFHPVYNPTGPKIPTQDNSVLMQSDDLNAMANDFKWPQVWTTNLAIDQKLPWDLLGTLEVIYGKDINAVYVRNANLGKPVGTLNDGRPFFGGAIADTAFTGGAYIIDNNDEGSTLNITAQLRKLFNFGLSTTLSYNFLEAKNTMTTTEIASFVYGGNPVQGDPNNPDLGYSQFGQRHRIIGGATYKHRWNNTFATSFGLFFEAAEGNRFITTGGNRYSFIYAGDVNGDGQGGNDLIYIPKNQGEIIFSENDASGNFFATPDAQWAAFNAFIEQDDYLSENRGTIAERNGLVNPWYFNIDLRILQDFSFLLVGKTHTFQLSFDILNVANLLNSSWGVRKVADTRATSPLQLVGFDSNGEPMLNFDTNVKETFIDDPGLFSRWQMQMGLRYFFN
jgi:hypothetical protein